MKTIQTKQITIQRGHNIGTAIINSFTNYNKIKIKSLDVARDLVNKVNVATVNYSY